ncbi:uncharacterized protein [Primulina eburnea]|uniref:uncharacterized protein n=1 Tax=Primulina eburnea TaxID=1245227 RepID=UPI003C6C00DB
MGQKMVQPISGNSTSNGNAQFDGLRASSSSVLSQSDCFPAGSIGFMAGSTLSSSSPVFGGVHPGNSAVNSVGLPSQLSLVNSGVGPSCSAASVLPTVVLTRSVPPTVLFRDILRCFSPLFQAQSFADVDSMHEVSTLADRDGIPCILFLDQHPQVKEVPKPTVGSGKIMIKVAAIGLNIYDTWRRQGIPIYFYDRSPFLGYVCSGKVVDVGSAVSDFNEGDEVCAILDGGGGYAEFVVVPQAHVMRIPSRVSLTYAVALPQASCLTFYTLSILTKIIPGKIIMIHGAGGDIGIMALQYAKHVGCEVFAAAGELDSEETAGAGL